MSSSRRDADSQDPDVQGPDAQGSYSPGGASRTGEVRLTEAGATEVFDGAGWRPLVSIYQDPQEGSRQSPDDPSGEDADVESQEATKG